MTVMSAEFPSREISYELVLTAMLESEADSLGCSELESEALHYYHCCLWPFSMPF